MLASGADAIERLMTSYKVSDFLVLPLPTTIGTILNIVFLILKRNIIC